MAWKMSRALQVWRVVPWLMALPRTRQPLVCVCVAEDEAVCVSVCVCVAQ